jgi:hypothetical protein
MSQTTLELSNGTTVTLEHPEGVTKEQLRRFAEKEQKPTENAAAKDTTKYLEDKESPSVGTDLKRVLLDTQRDVVSLIDYLPGDAFGLDDMGTLTKQKELSRLAGFGYLETSEHIDPLTGKIKAPETAIGIAASIVPYVAGAGALVKAVPKLAMKFAPKLAARSVPKAVQYTAAGAATSQVLTDLDENLFNVVSDVFPEGTQNTVIQALQADENDTQASKRLKMLIGDVGLGVTVDALFKAAPMLKNIITAKKPTADDVVEGLKEFSKAEELTKVSLRTSDAETRAAGKPVPFRGDLPTEPQAFKSSPDDLAQIEAQKAEGKKGVAWAKAKINQVGQQIFTSRGYAPSKMFAMFNQSQAEQRGTIVEATQIARRLNNAFKTFTDEATKTTNIEKAQELLTTDLSKYTTLDIIKQATRLSADQGIGVEVAEAVLDARYLIDKLSNQISGTKGFKKEALKSIQENMGTYLRTSYKAFDDPSNWKLDDVLKQTAIDDLLPSKMAEVAGRASSKNFSEDKIAELAEQLARKDVDDILKQVTDKETVDHLTQVQRVAKFHKKTEDMPQSIKDLLGEIKDPADNIILSVSKAARIYEVNNFYQIANQLGKNGKYIQTAASEGVRSKRLSTKITNTNSILDGKYTTPEVAKFLNRQEETFKFLSENSNGAAEAYKVFLKYKGTSQASKTVYSHVTGLRNIIGGAQFAIANGNLSAINPLSKNRGHMKVLWNNMDGKGDKELDQIYKKYVDLGVINTNLKVNQFRELINISSKDFGTKKLTTLINQNRILKGMENFYMATDDYFKMSGFLDELETLKKAKPNSSLDVLEREAADIIQDTIPNYDRVPKGLKKLNYLPVGNFISFPAEILRTSFHIVKQASKEINSGNTVLRNRGLRRLSGFTAAAVGVNEASKLSANLIGWTEEERQQHTLLAEGKYDKNSSFIWNRRENGDITKVSTKYLDSYNTIKEPVLAALDRIVDGELKGEQLEDYIFKAGIDGMLTLSTPFVSESIATKATLNVLEAIRSPDGKTSDGKVLLPPSMSTAEKLSTSVFELFKAVEPGSVTSLRKLGDSVDAYTGEELEKLGPVNKDAFITNITGIRISQHDPDSALKFAVSDFNKQTRANVKPIYKVGKDTAVTMLDNYIARQSKNYDYQQDLFRKVSAYSSINGRYKTLRMLTDSGLSDPAARDIYNGKFKPTAPPKIDDRIIEVLKASTPEDVSQGTQLRTANREYTSVFREFQKLSLYGEEEMNPFDDPEEAYERLGKSTGGEVTEPVSNAPKEPDERINKLTGLPYNEGAGPAYMDIEDPLRALNMAAGGRVKKNTGGKVLNALKRNCNK